MKIKYLESGPVTGSISPDKWVVGMKKRKNITIDDRNRWITKWEKEWSAGKYEPFIKTGDVASFGTKHKCQGIKSKRVHHFLSKNEYLFFVLLEFQPEVIEIYEQFPLLPVIKTLLISEALEIKHPRYIRTTTNMVLTTDFLVKLDSGEWKAYSVKPAKSMGSKRTVQKQIMEKTYWEFQGIDWCLVLDRDIKTTASANLSLLRHYASPPTESSEIITSWKHIFSKNLSANNRYQTSEIIRKISEELEIHYAASSSIFFHLLWHREIGFELNTPIELEKTASELGIFCQ